MIKRNERLKETINQQKIVIEDEKEKLRLEILKQKSKEEKESEIFSSKEEGLNYIEKKLGEHSLELLVVGREELKQLEEDRVEIKFYINLIGDEDSIYNFFKEIYLSDKNITVEEDGFFLEKKEYQMEAKVNLMYISKNKKNEIDFSGYKNNIFNRKNIRVLKRKRRML